MTRHFRSDEEIARIARGVFDRSLPKPEWTHAAHFAAALWVLRHGPHPAETALRAAIPAYNTATGVPNTDASGYHETITLASVAAARARLAEHPPAAPLHLVLDAVMAGPLGRSDWLLAHWTKAALFSAEARRSWVGPNLKPLPFAAPGSVIPGLVPGIPHSASAPISECGAAPGRDDHASPRRRGA